MSFPCFLAIAQRFCFLCCLSSIVPALSSFSSCSILVYSIFFFLELLWLRACVCSLCPFSLCSIKLFFLFSRKGAFRLCFYLLPLAF